MKLLVFIFLDENRAHFAQIVEGLLKQPFLLRIIYSGPLLNQGKQDRSRVDIKRTDFTDLADTLFVEIFPHNAIDKVVPKDPSMGQGI